MKRIPILLCVFSLISTLSFLGCTQPEESPEPPKVEINPKDTIGSLTRSFATEAIPVRGIGLVAGLAGTGSSECPPSVRQGLEKYIWKQVGSVNPRALIDSLDTAVVEISGVIPAFSSTLEPFDVVLRPLSSTQTTSLDGGYLYTAQLKELSRLTNVEAFVRFSKILATVDGPVYTQTVDSSQHKWFVLGGGRAKQDNTAKLILNAPDFAATSAIRNRINERFGPKTATAVSTAEITLAFPAAYFGKRDRFLKIVESLILAENPDLQSEYAQELIAKITSKSEDIESAEIALEGIGKPGLDSLAPLLNHPDPTVQFHIARCMMNIGDSRSLAVLRLIIANEKSPYRVEAIRTVGQSAKRRDALPILTNVLNTSHIQSRLEAYEMLVTLNTSAVSRRSVANGAFAVDSVLTPGPKMIYVYRQQAPKIVIFGAPLHCKDNTFVQSEDRTVTINSLPDSKYISVSRKHPSRHRVLGPLLSSYELSSLIQTLGELPDVKESSATQPGLAVPYAEIIRILETMCTQGAIPAQFFAGSEPAVLSPEPERVLQDSPSN
ncbi:MAG: flagellar basal body P-ring protein FlgI [Planctomycetota bacterium]